MESLVIWVSRIFGRDHESSVRLGSVMFHFAKTVSDSVRFGFTPASGSVRFGSTLASGSVRFGS
eukprot:12431514-Karenia_brevis.AAC.2